MNRTASDGHATIRALLDHTEDPLPIVLALDELDPDDPTTKSVASEIINMVASSLRQRCPRNSSGITPIDRRGRPFKAGLTDQEKNLINNGLMLGQITPATALQYFNTLQSAATKLQLPLTLPPFERHIISAHLTGTPSIHIQTTGDLETNFDGDDDTIGIDVSGPMQLEAQFVKAADELNNHPDQVDPADTTLHRHLVYLRTQAPQQELPKYLRILQEVIKKHVPNAKIQVEHHDVS